MINLNASVRMFKWIKLITGTFKLAIFIHK